MPVSFSYSGERVFTKKSSKPLMNELSWTTVIDLTAALARRGATAAAAPPTRAVVRNSRRVLMRPPPRRGGPVGAVHCSGKAEGLRARRTEWSVRDQAPTPSGPPRSDQLGSVSGTLGPAGKPVKAPGGGA